MEVILLDNIGKLGGLGDKVTVKPGYGRNYLVPYGLAVPATKENVEAFEASKRPKGDSEAKGGESGKREDKGREWGREEKIRDPHKDTQRETHTDTPTEAFTETHTQRHTRRDNTEIHTQRHTQRHT